MVAMQMGEKDGTESQRVYTIAEKLLLCSLSCIEQVVLFVDIDHLCRGMSPDGGLGRRRTEYGDAETHVTLFAHKDREKTAYLPFYEKHSVDW